MSGANNLSAAALSSCFCAAADHGSSLLHLSKKKQFHESRNSEFPMETQTSSVQCKYNKYQPACVYNILTKCSIMSPVGNPEKPECSDSYELSLKLSI